MLSHQLPPLPPAWFPLSGPDDDVILYSEVTLSRNLASLPFVPRMGSAERLELRKRVEQVLQQRTEAYLLADSGQISSELARYLTAQGLFVPAADEEDRGAGGIAVWPEDATGFVRLGSTDHLEIVSRSGGLSLRVAREQAERLDTILEEALDYAVSLQLGYLGPDIRRVGAGLSVAVHAHLPALEQSGGIASLDRGGQGEYVVEHNELMYRVALRSGPGEADGDSLAALAGYAERLVHYERDARAEIVRRHGEALEEAANRALGTLLHARRLDADEALELLNIVRLARAVDLIATPDTALVTELLLASRDSHVAVFSESPQDAMDLRRAAVLQALYRSRSQTGV